MQFISFLWKRSSFSITLSIVFLCLSAPVILSGQDLPKTNGQNLGTADPLSYSFRNLRRDPNISQKRYSSPSNRSENILPSAGELDSTFNPVIDSVPGSITSSALQADGKFLVGGDFKTLGGVRRKYIARLNVDNTIDQTFLPNVNGVILAMTLQPDGRILIGGLFTAVNGINQNGLARLNTDGSLDSSFNAEMGGEGYVYDISVQPDGKILIGGSFIPYILRLNADGSIDTTFISPLFPNGMTIPSIVYSVGFQTNGKVLIGGFLQIPSGFPGSSFAPVLRLNSDGTIDSSFNSVTSNSNVFDLEVQPDDKILIGGSFFMINGVDRPGIARLNADGTLDESFSSGIMSNLIRDIELKPDGHILVGFLINTSGRIAVELNSTGAIVKNYDAGQVIVGPTETVNQTASGKIFVGGAFSTLSSGILNTAALFNTDGSLDPAFNLNSIALGGVKKMLPLPDGKMLVGGYFNRVNGEIRDSLVKLNADGTIDDTFISTSISAIEINNIVLQPDGKILVGGISVSSTSEILGNLIRLNADGTVDTSFDTSKSLFNSLKKVVLLPDGKILVSYSQRSFFLPGGNIVKLNSDGSLDESFMSGVAFPFEDIVVQSNGQILVGGPVGIRYINSGTGENVLYQGIFRLNSDGSHDRSFRIDFEGSTQRFTKVYSLALQPDGKILVGGILYIQSEMLPVGIVRLDSSGTFDPTFRFNTISNSTGYDRVDDIELLPGGKMFAAGLFSELGGESSSRNIVRLNSDGTTDNSFTALTDTIIYDVEIQSDGKVLIGGDFENVNGAARTSIARLLSEPGLQRRARFDFDGDNRTDISIFRPTVGEWWYLRSSDGSNRAFQFGSQTDKIVPADFTGDGLADLAFFRPSTGEWFFLRSEDSSFYSFPFGSPGDIPAPSDFDGDGKSDVAVFRPANATWYILNSSGGTTISQFGVSEDIPMPEDYDGDGKADLAVFRPSVGEWWISTSTGGNLSFQFGASGDKPLSADFTGDGKADVAVWREASGEWFVLRSENNSYYSIPFGLAGDIPVAGDYDGDGIADIAVFRPSSNVWYLQQSTNGFSAVTFGAAGDKPVPAAFVP